MSRFLSTLVVLLSAVIACAQPPDTLWTRTWWPQHQILPWCGVETPEGDFLVGGVGLGSGGLIFRLTANGDTLWHHNYPGNTFWGPAAVCAASDGNYVWSEMSVGRLMKTDSDGNVLWQREYDAGFSWGSLLPTSDGGFVTAGTAPESWLPDEHEIRLMKINTDGDSLWGRVFQGLNGTSADTSVLVLPAEDGGFLLFGGTNYVPGQFTAYGMAIRTDAEGNSLWVREYPNIHDYYQWGVVTDDGGYIVSHANRLLKINAEGDSVWARTLNDLPLAYWITSIQATWDHGFILSADDWSVFPRLLKITKLNSEGELEWETHFPAFVELDAARAIQTADSGFFAIAQRGIPGDGILAVRLAPEIIDTAKEPAPLSPSSYALGAYPNPFNPVTTISFSLPQAGDVTLTVYDVTGRAVAVLTEGKYAAGDHGVVFDAANLPSGIYFAHVVTEHGFVATRKLMLLK